MAHGTHEKLPKNAGNLKKDYTMNGGKSAKVLGSPKLSTIQSENYSLFHSFCHPFCCNILFSENKRKKLKNQQNIAIRLV